MRAVETACRLPSPMAAGQHFCEGENRSKDSQLFVPGLLLSVLYCIILPREVRALVLMLQTWKLRPRELNLPRVIELGSGRQVLKLDGVAPEATPVTTG